MDKYVTTLSIVLLLGYMLLAINGFKKKRYYLFINILTGLFSLIYFILQFEVLEFINDTIIIYAFIFSISILLYIIQSKVEEPDKLWCHYIFLFIVIFIEGLLELNLVITFLIYCFINHPMIQTIYKKVNKSELVE